jgi:hypothetical protein
MGMNTAAIFLHDLIHELESDPDIGKKIARVLASGGYTECQSNAVKFLPCGHSSTAQIVAVGGNTIRTLGYGNSDDDDVALLRKLADHLGYTISKKPEKKSRRRLGETVE